MCKEPLQVHLVPSTCGNKKLTRHNIIKRGKGKKGNRRWVKSSLRYFDRIAMVATSQILVKTFILLEMCFLIRPTLSLFRYLPFFCLILKKRKEKHRIWLATQIYNNFYTRGITFYLKFSQIYYWRRVFCMGRIN